MNQKSFVISAILAATALSVIATPLAYAQTTVPPTGDISATLTGQNVQQKNSGSGESHNSNCGQNLIKAGVDEQECESED
jgi:hypothetical protein